VLQDGTWQSVERKEVGNLLVVFDDVAVYHSFARDEVVFHFF